METTKTEETAGNIIIPEEFNKRLGIREDNILHVGNKPRDKSVLWVTHPRSALGPSIYIRYRVAGYKEYTEKDIKADGVKLAFYVTDENGWVCLGGPGAYDSVLMWAPKALTEARIRAATAQIKGSVRQTFSDQDTSVLEGAEVGSYRVSGGEIEGTADAITKRIARALQNDPARSAESARK